MAQKKLKRFAELLEFEHVLQYPENTKGTWAQRFGNNRPIVLELACGKGEYAIGLAQLHPDRNYIGVDVKGNRLWVGAKKCMANGINNVIFLRTQIDRIDEYFAPGEVTEIWITFPDPQLRWSKMKKRLTHPKFLRLYNNFLPTGGLIHLKTDSPDLYIFTKKVIELLGFTTEADIDDVHNAAGLSEELKIQTHYEGLDISGSGRIYYLRFRLDRPVTDIDQELKNIFNFTQHAASDRGD
jgi:tRNA (guanine-N7-)-methyltransferase